MHHTNKVQTIRNRGRQVGGVVILRTVQDGALVFQLSKLAKISAIG
jgi:hypothetical protein